MLSLVSLINFLRNRKKRMKAILHRDSGRLKPVTRKWVCVCPCAYQISAALSLLNHLEWVLISIKRSVEYMGPDFRNLHEVWKLLTLLLSRVNGFHRLALICLTPFTSKVERSQILKTRYSLTSNHSCFPPMSDTTLRRIKDRLLRWV